MARKATRKAGQPKKTGSASSSRKKSSGKSQGGGAASRGKAQAKKSAAKKAPIKRKPNAKARPSGKVSGKAPAARRSASKKTTKRRATRSKTGPALMLGHNRDDLHGGRIIEELDTRHGIDVSTIDVGIRDGKAKVRGLVSDKHELAAVRETIAEVGGISELEYLVQIAPDRRETDRDRAREIQDVIDGDVNLQAENIQVAFLNKKVVLRGSVANSMHKVTAGLLALRQDSVQRIRNRIVVVE